MESKRTPRVVESLEEEIAVAMNRGPRVRVPPCACSQCLDTIWIMGQSLDLGSRRRARIGYNGDLEEWRGWQGVETSRSGRLTEGYNDLTER